MWRPNESVVESISDRPGNGRQNKRRRSRRPAWRDGLADQTVVKTLEHVRSYRTFERALIASVDPRSALELGLAHRLASLLWRLRRASAIETGLFEIQGGLLFARRPDLSGGPRQPGALPTAAGASGHSNAPGANGRDDRPARDQELLSTSMRATALANVSCAFPILTQPCLTAWAVTKRDYGARQRKPFGRSTRCDSRRLQCGDGCAGSRPSPGIGRGRSPLTQNLGIECREDDVASAAVHWVNQ